MLYKSTLFKKTATVTICILLMSLLAALAGTSGMAGGIGAESNTCDVTAQQLSSKLIRLHVIANSDSPEDQNLKLRVRDAIVEAFNKEFEGIDDINVSREFIKNNLKYIEELASEEIKKSGKNYSVTAVFGKFLFPVKNYGYITLPAGEYEALRVIIGNGSGANWWCILFPPLCFVDVSQKQDPDETRMRMSQVLTPKEMAAIETAKAPEDVPIEIRFKVLDWWEEAKGKINKTIKLTFK